jgi:inner membrane protein
MVGYFADYTDHSFYAVAAACLIIDLYLLRKSGVLLCIGIGSLLTGVFISLGLIESYEVALVMLVGFSCATGGLLWDYFKQQDDNIRPAVLSTIVGKILPASAPITKTGGRVYYSGTEWLARLDNSSDKPIGADSKVEITGIDGEIMLVRVA